MTVVRNAVGRYGERVAGRVLVEAGMIILDRNWRCPTGELDLVALQRPPEPGGREPGSPEPRGPERARSVGAGLRRAGPDPPTIVFCEVKTRRGDTFGAPVDAVDRTKVRRLRAVAALWLAAHPDIHGEIRFDVISVWPQLAGAATVEHLRGAF